MNNAIEIKNLTKKYDKLTAVSGISFEVQKNEVFGLLGENGAGKTTTLEMIEGLRKPTSGEIIVLNHNFKEGINSIKEKIGVQLQSSAYFNFLTLKEILDLFGSFYSHHLDSLELLKMVGLEDKAKSYVGNLSGGQKQRFSIVASLINDPQIVFLDEPTTGLDPLARRHTWDIISEIKKQGKTIVLTTHYMEEAEILCDRVAIMEEGKVIAIGNTHKLIERAQRPFKLNFYAQIDQNCLNDLKNLGEIENILGKSNHYEMKLKTQENLNNALRLVQKVEPESLTVGRATLEDLFIELTGKNIEE
ncbi:MAG: ABC transporter ATP-binding protein [Patescibacteria group bacterium]|nr:ABC transporter ATP-binding protein [Patescibacteria group bacterium]